MSRDDAKIDMVNVAAEKFEFEGECHSTDGDGQYRCMSDCFEACNECNLTSAESRRIRASSFDSLKSCTSAQTRTARTQNEIHLVFNRRRRSFSNDKTKRDELLNKIKNGFDKEIQIEERFAQRKEASRKENDQSSGH